MGKCNPPVPTVMVMIFPMIRRSIIPVIILLVTFDLGFSFLQYASHPLDGDLAPIVLPSKGYQTVLDHPFGLPALLEGERYAAPNRYFAHWFMGVYFKFVPHLLQSFCTPLESIYLACALLKTLIHILLLGLLARFIGITFKATRHQYWFILLLLFPLFQANGYTHFGLIFSSITYTVFYALPLALLLLFFLPFYEFYYKKTKEYLMPLWQKGCWVILAIFIASNGPLVPPIVLLCCPAILFFLFYQNYKQEEEQGYLAYKNAILNIPPTLLFHFVLLILLCLYSFYIGTFNIENTADVPLRNRYALMLEGLFHQITRKLGLPLLLVFIFANVLLLRSIKNKIGQLTGQIAIRPYLVFFVVYLLLLPLGGARTYRMDIIRADTFMPITLGLFYLFGVTTFFIVQNLEHRHRKLYLFSIGAFLCLLTVADEPQFYRNQCEQNAIQTLAASPKKLVKLSNACTIMAWNKNMVKEYSAANCQLLEYWGVLDKEKYYFQ